MEQVLTFLNVRTWSLFTAFFLGACISFSVLQDAREDLRCSMARDVVTIKNESIRIDEDPDCMEPSYNAKEEKLLSQLPKDACLDFQKKVTLSKHEKKDNDASSFFGNKVSYEQLVGM
jgi:tRNA guanosine-2'-O-methyltransferase